MRTEGVIGLGDAHDPSDILVPELIAGGRESIRRAVEDVHRSRIGLSIDTLIRHTDRKVIESIAIEVAHGDGRAESLTRLGEVKHAGRVLSPELIAACAQTGA